VLLDYRGGDFAEMYLEMLRDFVAAAAGKGGSAAAAGLAEGLSAIEICCQAESHSFPPHHC
jgi:hypothetical protein